MGWRTFRDRLGLILIVGIPVIWILAGTTPINLPAEVIGATIAMWTLCIQFYFRKKGEDEEVLKKGDK